MIKDKNIPALVTGKLETTLNTLDYRELGWCRWFNSYLNRKGVEPLFAAVSRVGDGVVWYLAMLLLPLFLGKEALIVVAKMMLAGFIGLLIYKRLKTGTRRQRPCRRHDGIQSGVPPLDEYSFPSGHTLHAVGFTAVMGAHYPVLLWVFFPLSVLIAMSRVVLGLHYPSDVIVGALIGWIVAAVVILI